MQIYDSALTFSLRNTALFRTYGGLHIRNVDVISGSETDWNPVLAVLKGHTVQGLAYYIPIMTSDTA